VLERSKDRREIPEVTLAGHADGLRTEIRDRKLLRVTTRLSDRQR
jgi:hypothetical protein